MSNNTPLEHLIKNIKMAIALDLNAIEISERMINDVTEPNMSSLTKTIISIDKQNIDICKRNIESFEMCLEFLKMK